MQDPILKFQKYFSETETLVDICSIQTQYFTPEQTYDLFEHEYVKRYDTHWYHKIGEMNCREHQNKVLFSTEKNQQGYIFSMAKVIARTEEHHPHDHLVVSWSGYGDCTGNTFILDLATYSQLQKVQNTPIIDDYDLLMQKYNEICNT